MVERKLFYGEMSAYVIPVFAAGQLRCTTQSALSPQWSGGDTSVKELPKKVHNGNHKTHSSTQSRDDRCKVMIIALNVTNYIVAED